MKVIYFVLFFSFLVSCQNKTAKKEDDLFIISSSNQNSSSNAIMFNEDLKAMIENFEQNEIFLSSYFKEIEYIPLQTSSHSLIGGGRHGIQQYLVTDKVIVADMKIFSRKDGHYMGNLLKQGQGPEEYIYIMGLDADDTREEFYLYDSSLRRIHVVGYDNSYKGTIGGCGDYANVISCGNGNILIPNYSSYTQRYDAFFIDNVDTKEVICKQISPALKGISSFEECKRLKKTKSYVNIVGDIHNRFWKYGNYIRYYDTLTDTIYTITKEFEINPFGYLDTEKLRMTLEESRIGFMKRNFYAWNLHKIYESKDCLLFYLYKSNSLQDDLIEYWVFYSKNDKKITTVKYSENSKELPFINDLDQGIAFVPYFSTSSGDGICRFLSAESIKNYISKKGRGYFTTEKGKAFKAMGDRLKYDDNDVVAIMKWK